MFIKLIAKIFITVLALFIVAYYVPGITIDGFYTALVVALIFGLLNITIKPILIILTLPINLLTLGLFTFIINGALFWFVASFVDGFYVVGFLPAVIGAFIVSVVSWIGNKLI